MTAYSRRAFVFLGMGAAGMALIANSKSAFADEEVFPVTKTEDEWRKILTPEQFRVLRKHGTERPFSSPLEHEKREGTFHCAGCGAPLFSSAAKFDSGTGWPSFFDPLAKAVGLRSDNSFFMKRTEVHCATCGGHLGHVFDDGPPPTGKRYCMNGVAMTFTQSGLRG